MLEKDIENLIAEHPDDIFPGEGFTLISQQYTIERKRIDILFEDKHKRKVIIEVKRGILSREASGQITEYYGLLKSKNQDEIYELILCANTIPPERKVFLANMGIECKELGIAYISELAKKYGYTFLDDRSSFTRATPKMTEDSDSEVTSSNDEEISVWIFQGNPQRYDVTNALSDEEIGNTFHWTINQHKDKIKKGHLGLIWMSGPEAGIYALTRIESDPSQVSETPPEAKYWLDSPEKKVALRVRLTILKRLINRPILRKTLLELRGLQNLSILKQAQGTNFPVRDEEWRRISEIL